MAQKETIMQRRFSLPLQPTGLALTLLLAVACLCATSGADPGQRPDRAGSHVAIVAAPGMVPDALKAPGRIAALGRQLNASVTVLQLGSPATPYMPAVLRALRRLRPARVYLLGLRPHQRGTLYFHTREDDLPVFDNPQPGTISGVPDLAAAIRSARRYAPRGRPRSTGAEEPTVPQAGTPVDISALPGG